MEGGAAEQAQAHVPLDVAGVEWLGVGNRWTMNGICNYDGCDQAPARGGHAAVRPQLRCGSCKDGEGAYYHIPCFFATHRCVHNC